MAKFDAVSVIGVPTSTPFTYMLTAPDAYVAAKKRQSSKPTDRSWFTSLQLPQTENRPKEMPMQKLSPSHDD